VWIERAYPSVTLLQSSHSEEFAVSTKRGSRTATPSRVYEGAHQRPSGIHEGEAPINFTALAAHVVARGGIHIAGANFCARTRQGRRRLAPPRSLARPGPLQQFSDPGISDRSGTVSAIGLYGRHDGTALRLVFSEGGAASDKIITSAAAGCTLSTEGAEATEQQGRRVFSSSLV
jgi:hypothetical protein